MKFKKSYLNVIIAFILGILLSGGIVYAATSASQVTYKDGKTVEEALNELYKNKDILINASKYKEIVLIEENISGLSKDKSIDVKSKYPNYSELTNNDFKLIITDNSYDTNYVAGDKHPSVSYDANTGIATVNAGVMAFSKGARVWNIVSLYIIK